jgi:hypothetical protein
LYENSHTSREYSAGYHFLFSPPKVKPDAEMRKKLSIPDNIPTFSIVKRDILRFTAQVLAIPFLAVGFLLILADKKSFEKTALGSISIFVGSLFTALVCLINWR